MITTKKELIEALAEYPDDTEICFESLECPAPGLILGEKNNWKLIACPEEHWNFIIEKRSHPTENHFYLVIVEGE